MSYCIVDFNSIDPFSILKKNKIDSNKQEINKSNISDISEENKDDTSNKNTDKDISKNKNKNKDKNKDKNEDKNEDKNKDKNKDKDKSKKKDKIKNKIKDIINEESNENKIKEKQETINEYNFYDYLVIDSKIEFGQNVYKYGLYYINEDAEDIYIKSPKIRILYDWNNMKYNQLKIRITPRYDKTNEFIKFIKAFEKNLSKNKIFKNQNIELCSILFKKEDNYYIKIYYKDENLQITSNNNKQYKINDFKANSEIQLVIKVNGIWQKNDKYGLSIEIYQIKYFPCLTNNFIDLIDNVPKIKPVINYREREREPEKKQQITELKEEAPKMLPRPVLMINKELLQSVKLKSIKENNDNKSDN